MYKMPTDSGYKKETTNYTLEHGLKVVQAREQLHAE